MLIAFQFLSALTLYNTYQGPLEKKFSFMTQDGPKVKKHVCKYI